MTSYTMGRSYVLLRRRVKDLTGEEARREAMNRLGGELVCTRCGDPLDTWTLKRAKDGEKLGDLERLCSKCFDLYVEDFGAHVKVHKSERKRTERQHWKADRQRRAGRR